MQSIDMPVESFREEMPSNAASQRRFGFLVLSNDLGIERELGRLAPPSISAHVSRVRSYVDVGMADSLASVREAASLLVPHESLDGIAYGCTSHSFLADECALAGAVDGVRPGIPFHTPRSTAVRALQHLALKRIALLTPYEDELNSAVAVRLGKEGVTVAEAGSFYCASDCEIARLPPERIARAAEQLLKDGDAEGIFIACNALQCGPVIDQIEEKTGKVVVASTQAMVWGLLRSSEYASPSYGYGKLLRT